ncbi:MAG: hypothetical protein K9N35_07735 [Candidatus Marinimicrobia bacterium]|nr:hypothetical protein [Candidatus Neomarinimicrobiota bacterium]
MFKSILVSSLIFVSFIHAEIGLEYYTGIQDHYIWRGYDLSSDKPMVTPGITLGLGDNIWFDIWTGLNQDYKELDLTAAYYLEPNDNFGADLGLVVYTYPGMDGAEASYEPFITIYSYSLPAEPQLLVGYDLTLETYYIELAASKAILEDAFPINLQASAGIYGWEGYAGISNLQFAVAKDFEVIGLGVTPSIAYHFIPQGFRDEDMTAAPSGLVFEINISAGGSEE